jgi:hypothetical protein
MRKCSFVFGVVVALALVPAASAQFLMVPDSSNDVIVTFDPFDGSLINSSFIDLNAYDPGTPKQAMAVGSEIWVVDQLRDKLTRFSLDGSTYLGELTGPIDNIRGMEVVGNTAYLSNSGTNNGAPGEAVVTIDIPSLTFTGHFVTGDDGSGDPFDVLAMDVGGTTQLLINDIDGEDIDWHRLDGSFLSVFHESDGINGIDFPQQMNMSNAGTVLAAGFSSPSGIYEYRMDGSQLNYWDVGSGARGVYPLGNGNIMFTDGGGVWSLDPATGGTTQLYDGGSSQYIEFVPEPASLMLIALALVIRRR